MRTNLQQTSPCLRCTRVKDPRSCENKNCQVWQRWFINRWDLLRGQPLQAKEQEVLMPVGISVGGTRYAHPNHTRKYLQNDPCKACRCPKDLCTTPCPSRRAWEESRKDVLI